MRRDHTLGLRDLALVARLVRGQFPERPATSVEFLGEGCDSVAFEIDHQWVFRFPKQSDVEAGLVREAQVLAAIAGASPVALPMYRYLGRPTSEFPFHFGGYRRLPGVPVLRIEPTHERLRAWARPIAEFLSWLHAFPIGELPVERCDLAALVREVRRDSLDDFHRLPASLQSETWRAHFERAPDVQTRSEPVLVHRDFAAEHVLCDPETLEITGVIDWTDLGLCDRAADFGGLYHWGGEPFVEAVLEHYEGSLDDAGHAVARYLAAGRGVSDVVFGEDFARPEYVAEGLRALTLLAPGIAKRDGAAAPSRARSE